MIRLTKAQTEVAGWVLDGYDPADKPYATIGILKGRQLSGLRDLEEWAYWLREHIPGMASSFLEHEGGGPGGTSQGAVGFVRAAENLYEKIRVEIEETQNHKARRL
jgi:hypothetical protein